MSIRSQTVYGETIEDLLPGLVAIIGSMRLGADGMCHMDATLAPKDGMPVQKALMRAEAALMLEDADRIGSVQYEDRTYEQRAADAFVRLVQSMGDDPSIP